MSEKPVITTEFKEKLLEWQENNVTLKQVRKDVSALNSRQKELKTFLSAYMGANKIDKCNCRDGSSVIASKKVSKGSLTKDVIKAGLLEYCKTQEEADKCWDTIQKHLQPKESISLTHKQPKK